MTTPSTVAVPKDLLRELIEGLAKTEEVLATLEEIADREGLERIRRSREEYDRGEYEEAGDAEELRKLLK
ncbi:MAG: hypothetical protein ACE5KH_00080 [Candidatus Geothermarchaeales archaeon]